ncbi:MAG: proline--tRNA ligase [Tissierellia bacterium]|nr:proline--tRNA ligase [Tissierellia bacterium]
MRMSKLYMPTLREVPADAEIASHKLLLRGGMIRRSASGIYTYLPLGYRVVRKIEEIVREEMDNAGAQEILMSAIQPKEIWEASGRWSVYGPEMFKLKDRHEREFCLGPTAEEYFTDLIKGEVKSYKQLPLNIYQIQTKYRDEKRPRFGINRAREFSMKDAYSFDTNYDTMLEAYENMHQAYLKVFRRIGLDFQVVQGDSGAMGGNSSQEYIALAETGEGVICYTEDGSYAATDEKASAQYQLPPYQEPKTMEKVHTPQTSTIEEVANFLEVEENRCAKAMDLTVAGEPVLMIIPGDRELNMAKVSAYLGEPEHEIEMMSDKDIIEKLGSYPGYTGPVGIREGVRIIIDETLTKSNNLVIGANEEDYHYKNVCYGRDFQCEVAPDLVMVREGDKSPEGKDLHFARGIEVGNIFQLGTKYSEAIHATFLDENGKEQFFHMGSYGIGITRSVTAVVEQNYDDDGIIWPIQVAPYHVIITIINNKNEEQMKLGEEIYQTLKEKGIEVLLDDRKERPGVKFNDRDLIGIPLRMTIGKKAGENIIEYSTRKEMKNEDIPVEEGIERVLTAVQEGLRK